jgi:hypothetical protein
VTASLTILSTPYGVNLADNQSILHNSPLYCVLDLFLLPYPTLEICIDSGRPLNLASFAYCLVINEICAPVSHNRSCLVYRRDWGGPCGSTASAPQTKSGRSIPKHMAQFSRITCLEMWEMCPHCSKCIAQEVAFILHCLNIQWA